MTCHVCSNASPDQTALLGFVEATLAGDAVTARALIRRAFPAADDAAQVDLLFHIHVRNHPRIPGAST